MAEAMRNVSNPYINSKDYDMNGAEVLKLNPNSLHRSADTYEPGYINTAMYPGMAHAEVLKPNPESLSANSQETYEVPVKKADKRKLAAILGAAGLTVVAGLGLLQSCDGTPEPKPTPTPEPALTPTTTPTATAIPEATAVPTMRPTVQPTVTAKPFDYESYYDLETMEPGDFRWVMIRDKVENVFPDITPHSNLENDLTTAAAELSIVHDRLLPGEAWEESVGNEASIPDEEILTLERNCLLGTAPQAMLGFCSDVIITSGANLDEDNFRQDNAYQAGQRIDQALPRILQEISAP